MGAKKALKETERLKEQRKTENQSSSYPLAYFRPTARLFAQTFDRTSQRKPI
jgi:hypothetical protein